MADLPPEVDPTTIPAVMPRSVSLIDAAGKPLQALLNWFQALTAWFAKTAVDLQQKITMVNSETEGNTATSQELIFAFTTSDAAYAGRLDNAVATSGSNSANISALQFAITTSDSAFAGRIDTAQAQAAGGTANGQVYLVAQAAPAGWTAAYGVQLTAGSLQAGMQILVDTATSTSAIMFTASQFMLVDPAYLGGAPQTVFNYTGGVFRFLVPVLVGNDELDAHAATNGDIATGAPADVTLPLRAGSIVAFYVTWDGPKSYIPNPGTLYDLRLLDITSGSTVLKTTRVSVAPQGGAGSGGSSASYTTTPMLHKITIPSAGSYTYRAEVIVNTGIDPIGDPLPKTCSLLVVELSR